MNINIKTLNEFQKATLLILVVKNVFLHLTIEYSFMVILTDQIFCNFISDCFTDNYEAQKRTDFLAMGFAEIV